MTENNAHLDLAAGEELLLVISSDPEFRGEVQLELQRRQNAVRVAFVSGLEPARSALRKQTPAVILLEDRAVASAASGPRHGKSLLSAAVRTLVTLAPAVIVGNPEHRDELAPFLASGVADYVPRTLSCVPAAVAVVERWLRLRRGAAPPCALGRAEPDVSTLPSVAAATSPCSPNDQPAHSTSDAQESRDFGEALRHELNNPLTGILGNAELLIVELARRNIELPQSARDRLETIATLAVRMRETVRRLSEEWPQQCTKNPATSDVVRKASRVP